MADHQNAVEAFLNCLVQSIWDDDLHILPASSNLEFTERELIGVAGASYRLVQILSQIASRYAAIVINTAHHSRS